MTAALNQMRIFFSVVTALWVTAALVISVFIAGPSIEQRWAPVWDPMTVSWLGGGSNEAEFFGYKARGTCRLLPGEVMAQVRVAGVWRRTLFTVDGRVPTGVSRPEGWQSVGIWRFEQGGDRLRVTAHYSCHELWDTPATLGEWPMPSAGRSAF